MARDKREQAQDDGWASGPLRARPGGPAERFADRIGLRHPAAVFFAALFSAFAVLIVVSLAVGYVLTHVLLDAGGLGLSAADNGAIRELVKERSGSLDTLSAMLRGEQSASPARAPAVVTAAPVDVEALATSLRDEADRAREAFEAALGRRDVDGCVAAVLGLEEAIAAWQADTLQSDDADEARRVLRALVVRLGALAEQGAADPADAVAPFVEALLAVRTGARENKDFATSDLVRDRLVAAGVEVRDTPDGTTWSLTPT